MDDPEGRGEQRDILNQDALTLVDVDKLRTQTVGRGEGALWRATAFFVLHRDAVFTILQQARTGFGMLVDGAFSPAESGRTAPRPPCLSGAVAVNRSLACHSDIGLLKGIDAGREVIAVNTLP